jgi:YesN/AraC family two-component response regulator
LDALDKANQVHFDAVITDIVMPEMDGITLTRELSKKFPDLSIMVMTGFGDEYSADKAVAAGAKEFIKKPFSLSELHIRFQKMMQERKLFHQIIGKKEEIEKMSNEIIRDLQQEASESIEKLRKEMDGLRKKD